MDLSSDAAPTNITATNTTETDQSLIQTTSPSDQSPQSSPSPTVTPLASPSSSPVSTPATVEVTGVTLNEISNMLNVGATDQIIATIAPANATNQSVTWTSDTPSVATVDNNGNVTAVSAGSAIITATTLDGSFKATDAITVAVPVTSSTTNPSATSQTQTPTETPQTPDTTTLSADIAKAQTLLVEAVVGTAPGDYAQSDVDALQSAINSANSAESNINSLQSDINNADTALNTAVVTFKNHNQYVAVTYTTPAPVITDQNTRTGKMVTVSDKNEDPNHPDVDVLASATIPKIFKDGEESKIQIKWKSNSNQIVTFHAYDTDHSGYLNYVEWTVPHLSDQTFEIILISKAFQLDSGQNIVADIYSQVQFQDNIFATVPQGNYVRSTFYQTLDNTKDITVYARATDSKTPVSINVYPVYTDASGNQTEGPQLTLVDDGTDPDFSNITLYQKYRVLLKNLKNPTDVFDLQIAGGSIDIDYIVDPTPTTITDNFADTTKIASTTNVTVDTSSQTVYLSAASSWTCGSSFIDSRDGHTYGTVQIGGQCWMEQNLNVGTETAGANNQGTSCSASDGSDIQKYCFSDSASYCTSDGGLYQWNQAMCGSTTAGAQGICPTGWHVPTHDEWTTLEQAVCVAGGTSSGTCATTFPYDETTTGWLGTSANEGTSLQSGGASDFNGLLAGYRYTGGSFYNLGSTAYFWSSLESGSTAWNRGLTTGNPSVLRATNSQAYGFSVRCLKN